VQYLAALLTSVKSNQDKASVYLNECRLLDIPSSSPTSTIPRAGLRRAAHARQPGCDLTAGAPTKCAAARSASACRPWHVGEGVGRAHPGPHAAMAVRS